MTTFNTKILAASLLGLVLGLFFLIQKIQHSSGLYQSYAIACKQVEDIASAPQLISMQHAEIESLKEKSKRLQSADISLNDHVDMASYLENLCGQNALKMVSLPRGETEEKNGIQSLNIAFSIEGKLADILSGIHQLEYHDRAAVVRSLGLQTDSWYERGEVKHELVADVQVERMLFN